MKLKAAPGWLPQQRTLMPPPDSSDMPTDPVVTRVSTLAPGVLEQLLLRYGLQLEWVAEGAEIPGSYWKESEAGLIGHTVYARDDTPVHSVLHESCHAICMDAARRSVLHTDAGGSDQEECAVCYLEILLADQLPGYSRAQIFADMDAWGYHFRLGSTRAWFEQDAEDARCLLRSKRLIEGPQDVLPALQASSG